MDSPNREVAGVKRNIQKLLAECGLPSDNQTLSHLQHFLVMKKDDRDVVGVVGLESLPPAALIHSLAVQKSYRCQGLASQLLGEMEAYARAAGYGKLYLVALKGSDFFANRGYDVLTKNELPAFPPTLIAPQGVTPGEVVYLYKDLN